MPLPKVAAAPPRISRVDQSRAGWDSKPSRRPDSRCRRPAATNPGSSGSWSKRTGVARHVGVTRPVHRDARGIVRPASAEIGGVDELGAGGIEFGHKGIARRRRQWPERRSSEEGHRSRACYVGVAGGIDGDASGADAAEKRGVDQRRPRGIELRHEGADPDRVDERPRCLESPLGGGKLGRNASRPSRKRRQSCRRRCLCRGSESFPPPR